MTEKEARDWLMTHFGQQKLALLERFVGIVLAEAPHQNLIAPSTVDTIWARHVVDSAQLIALAPPDAQTWLDVGSGAGFPGIVIAILSDVSVTMLEPRRRRTDFLAQAVQQLGVPADICATSVQVHEPNYDVISARAVASLSELLSLSSHCSTWNTTWLLPKGAGALEEVAVAKKAWQGMFHVERSITNDSSFIVVAREVVSR